MFTSECEQSGTRTSFDVYVIYLYTEFHILLLYILSYGLREGYLSAYILNIRCHKIPVVKKWLVLMYGQRLGPHTCLLATKVVVLSTVNLKLVDQARPCISWESTGFQ
jgi:hypothetical protein